MLVISTDNLYIGLIINAFIKAIVFQLPSFATTTTTFFVPPFFQMMDSGKLLSNSMLLLKPKNSPDNTVLREKGWKDGLH